MHVRPLPRRDLDFLDNRQVVRNYYPHCAEVVREASGARFVAAFDHNVRSAAGKASKRRIAEGQQVQGPARVVHGDYTLTSAPQRLRDLTRPPGTNDTLRTVLGEGEALLNRGEVDEAIADGRFGIINLWRNIAPEPVAIDPLALCDAATCGLQTWWCLKSTMPTVSARTISPSMPPATSGTSTRPSRATRRC